MVLYYLLRRDNMELNWSLKEIYPSFESEEFKNDLEKLDQSI